MENFSWYVSHWDPQHMDILKNRELTMACSPYEMSCALVQRRSRLPTFATDRTSLPAPMRQSALDQDRVHPEGATASIPISSRE